MPGKAAVVFSWGSFKDIREGWLRVEGRVEEDRIVLEWTKGASKSRLSMFTKNGKNAFVDYIEDGGFRRGWLEKKE